MKNITSTTLRVLLTLIAFVATTNINAQIIKVYENNTLKQTYNNSVGKKYKVIIEKNSETHQYVDLGLPSGTLWATCNIGAEKPEDSGLYFAWGETQGYTSDTSDGHSFDWANYTLCNGTEKSTKKYCTTDGKTELESDDDAATVIWGNKWQIPSKTQINELLDNDYTTTEWTTQNNVSGYKITSLKNGNSIFLSAAGRREGQQLKTKDTEGQYWSRSLSTNGNFDNSSYLRFSSTSKACNGSSRYIGRSIRPVKPNQVFSVYLNKSTIVIKKGTIETLTATVSPSYSINSNVIWSSSDNDIATVDATGKVTGVEEGIATITATSESDSNIKATCTVTVYDHEYVDLGLPSKTLWATCNIGAENPEDFGDYFAWGETTPYYMEGHSKDNPCSSWNANKTGYNWASYSLCDNSEKAINKYCTSDTFGKMDGKEELEPDDDAATANWGSRWQMPSNDQMYELRDKRYTKTEWTKVNNVRGYKITSLTNGNSIFLPAAGYRIDSNLEDTSSFLYGHYWTRSLYISSNQAYVLEFMNNGMGWLMFDRIKGLSVRAVRVKK